MAGEYLDPVVAVLGGDSTAYQAMLTEAEARMSAFVAATTTQIAELDARMAALGAGGAGEAGAAAAAAAEAGAAGGAGAASAAAAEEEAAAARVVAAEESVAAEAAAAAAAKEAADKAMAEADAALTNEVLAEIERLNAGEASVAAQAEATAAAWAESMAAMKAETAAASEGLVAAQASAAKSTEAAGAAMTASASAGSGALSSLQGAAAAAGVGVVAAVAHMAGDFEQATNRLITSAGESQQNIGAVRDGILGMTSAVGFTAQQLAQAMYTVDSASFHGADSLTILKAASQGAKIEQADLGTTVDAVTTSLVDYHLGADQAATVMSKLVTAVGEGKTNLQELAGSLHSVTPLAANLGISLDEVTAAVATMTVHGMSADQATQNLADTIRHLANPTQTMISEMGQLGLSSQQLSQNLANPSIGLHGTLEQIYTAIMNQMGPAGQVLLGTFKQSASAAGDLQAMVQAMPPKLQQLAQGLEDGSLSLAGWKAGIKGLPADMDGMASQFFALYSKANGFNDALKAGSPAAQTFTAALAKVMGDSTGLNTALMLGGENADRFNQNIKDISGSSADAAGNVKNWNDVQQTFNQKLSDFEGAASTLGVELGNAVLPELKGFMDDLTSAGKNAGGAKGDIQSFGDAFKGVDDWVRSLTTDINNMPSLDLGGKLNDLSKFLLGTPDSQNMFKKLSDDMAVGLNNFFGGSEKTLDQQHQDFINHVKAMISGDSADVKGEGIKFGAAFADGINGTTPQVDADAGNLVRSLGGIFDDFTTTMDARGSAVGSKFADGIMNTLPQVDASAGALVSHLEGPLNVLLDPIGATGQKTGSNYAAGVASTLPQVDAAASGLSSGVSNPLGALPSSTYLYGANAGNSFANGVVSPLPQVNASAGALSNGVTGPLGSLPTAALNSGSSIGWNLAAGMNAQNDHVAAAASGLAATVRSHLPSSPAKTGPLSGSGSPDILGRNISRMIAAGMLTGRDDVARALSTVLGSPSQSAASSGMYASSLAGRAFSGASGGGLTVNVTVMGSLVQQQDLRLMIQDIILKHQGRNNSNGLSGVAY